MRIGRRRLSRWFVLIVSLKVLLALGTGHVSGADPHSRFFLERTGGDGVYRNADAASSADTDFRSIAPTGGTHDPDTVRIRVVEHGDVDLIGPDGSPIAAGTYRGVGQAWDPPAGKAGATFDQLACADGAAILTVHTVDFASPGIVSSLAADLVCDEAASTWWVLQVRFHSDVPAAAVSNGLLREDVDFDWIAIGQHRDRTITWRNIGDRGVSMGEASVDGAAAFAIRADDCSDATLAPGATCAVTVRSEPGSVGEKRAILDLPMDTPSDGQRIALFALAAEPTTLVLEVTPAGASPPDSFTLRATLDPPPGDGPFIGSVGFAIDGSHFDQAEVDADSGVATRTLSLQNITLPPGKHTVVATFTGDSWGYRMPSESEPVDFTVTIPTAVTLVTSADPVLENTDTTLTATVTTTQESLEGGTLTLRDASTDTLLGALEVGPSAKQLKIVHRFTPGDHRLVARYSGHGTQASSRAEIVQHVLEDTEVRASRVGAGPSVFHPVVDGYRDVLVGGGRLLEPAAVSVTIRSLPDTQVVATRSLGSLPPGVFRWEWDGRDGSGAALPGGEYRIDQRLVDEVGNTRSVRTRVALSRQAITWHRTSTTLAGRAYALVLRTRNGSIRDGASAFERGVLLRSGNGAAGVQYALRVQPAPAYRSVRFEVWGRSPSGRKALVAVWNPALGNFHEAASFDGAERIGPGLRWDGTSVSMDGRVRNGLVRAQVLVVKGSAPVSFDIGRVRVVYSYGTFASTAVSP